VGWGKLSTAARPQAGVIRASSSWGFLAVEGATTLVALAGRAIDGGVGNAYLIERFGRDGVAGALSEATTPVRWLP